MNLQKAGFVSIIGKPNVGKSTLMNHLVGERLSIITSKAQTTRHRIMGIVNGIQENTPFQLVYSDTPGIVLPQYELHQSMMTFVFQSLEDADIILWITDIYEDFEKNITYEKVLNSSKNQKTIVLINKIDLLKSSETIDEKIEYWTALFPMSEILPISALTGENIERIIPLLVKELPEHPAYFDAETLTDKPERFFAAEMIRERIFVHYKKEIPYSCEVVVSQFIESAKLLKIYAEIYVERTSQRAIILGHKGENIKKVATEARLLLETFFGKKVYLETFVKVASDWRKEQKMLENFGYSQG